MADADDLERRLRDFHDWLVRYADFHPNSDAKCLPEAADEIARLRAENEALREALRPFAREYQRAGADHLAEEMRWVDANGDAPEDPLICSGVTVGDFRRARTALKGSRHE